MDGSSKDRARAVVASNHLTPEARQENAATLAAALGFSVDSAAAALDLDIAVTADPGDTVAQHIATEVIELLSRTVRRASLSDIDSDVAAELVIGAATARTSGTRVYLRVSEDTVEISRSPDSRGPCAPIPRLFGLLAACYASGATLYHAIGGILPFDLADPLVIRFGELGIDLAALGQPVDLGHAYLAGAGAIGNGLLWAARHVDLRGQLDIVDDDDITSGNLNRQIWFDPDDIKQGKAHRLAAKAQSFVPGLVLVPRCSRLQNLSEKSDGPWLRRLIVAVDSRRARRALQNEFPGEVFDASTTDIREIVVHHHRQPTASACLSCIYEPDQEEFSRERHIAAHLGVPIEEVRSERISAATAQSIASRFAALAPAEIAGMAYDSLFKRLCAEGALGRLEDKRIVAPFAFVSVLAGTMLMLEMVRRLGGGSSARDFNYWRLSPWHPPFSRRRILRSRQPGCAFCGEPVMRLVNAQLWG